MNLTREVAQKVLGTVDAGLVSGKGEPIPGQMCVEAAVCYALGEPHGDRPTCVAEAVRAYKIIVNDSLWSSPEARAKGLRRVAIAQLGSDAIDANAFSEYVVLGVVNRILPIVLRRIGLEKEADACAAAANFGQACDAAAHAAHADRAARLADNAAASAAYADYAAEYAAVHAAADAASEAANAAREAANAAADAAAADEILSLAAEIAVEALQKCGSQGCQWLDLAS